MAFNTNVNGGRRFLHDRDYDFVWWGRPAPMHLFLGQYAMGEYDVRCSDVWRDCSLESPTRTGPPIPEGFRSEASNLGLQACLDPPGGEMGSWCILLARLARHNFTVSPAAAERRNVSALIVGRNSPRGECSSHSSSL